MMKRNGIFVVMLVAFISINADAANVVSRTSRASASRASAMNAVANTVAAAQVTTSAVAEAPEPEFIDTTPVVENKSSQFDNILNDASATNTDIAGNDLAKKIRAQRAALDAADNLAATVSASGRNNCDTVLRDCMTERCGNNFTKCAADTDTTFGTKLDACRRNTQCSANEFKLLSAEIKADRASAIKLKSFNDIIDCGERYDACIVGECGATYSRCLGKSAGDNAISKCATIARDCTSMDSGLASRTMTVFATLRQTAEKQISADEKKLYALRDQMKSVCARLGAMFDERSLDCVYTVNFRAGDDSTIMASKKAYAGGVFSCTPNWFGIDITTYMENANRLTREQTAASSAMLGSGVGMAVGAVTSGAVNRAIDSKTTADAANKAECERNGDKWNATLGKCVPDNSIERAQSRANRAAARAGIQDTDETPTDDDTNNDTNDNETSSGSDSDEQDLTQE